jgi:hypothetical protein
VLTTPEYLSLWGEYRIDEAKFVVGELGDELKSKLDGSTEGLTELKQLLEGLAITAPCLIVLDYCSGIPLLLFCLDRIFLAPGTFELAVEQA